MSDVIYGIDTSKPITAAGVRDALVECFSQAHCQMIELEGSDEKVEKGYCEQVVKQGFEKVGGDYEKPTKESLMKMVGYLSEYSKAFRNPEIIEKHKKDISFLIDKLE